MEKHTVDKYFKKSSGINAWIQYKFDFENIVTKSMYI